MTAAHFLYILHLADNSLIAGHRNSEWTGHGPVLEQDIAISNLALDLVGQARNLYQHAASIYNGNPGVCRPLIHSPAFLQVTQEIDEDHLAYLRDGNEYRNLLITEQTNGDWAKTILRQYFFSAYQQLLFEKLQDSTDPQLAAIAAKALKEVQYHVRWSGEWVIRLGDGTAESHRRMLAALDTLWPFTGELFTPALYETALLEAGISVDPSLLQADWQSNLQKTFEEATIEVPVKSWMQSGGKTGIHTEHLGYLLAELQYVQRAYPNSVW